MCSVCKYCVLEGKTLFISSILILVLILKRVFFKKENYTALGLLDGVFKEKSSDLKHPAKSNQWNHRQQKLYTMKYNRLSEILMAICRIQHRDDCNHTLLKNESITIHRIGMRKKLGLVNLQKQ